MFFCQIFIFIFLLALSLYKIGCISQNKLSGAYLILFRFALSFDKTGCASEEKNEQALFSSLSLHYLFLIRQAALRKNKIE